ncbi:MAG: hypothetical protein ABJD11_08845 [Gemmatimonadota bacterium]
MATFREGRRAAGFLVVSCLVAEIGCGRSAREDGAPASRSDSALSPAKSAESTAPASAGLVVIAPTRGDTLEEGRRYVIRWQGEGPRQVDISAAVGGKDKGHLVLNYDAALDSLSWTIPVGFITGFGPSIAENVRLRFEDASNPARYVESSIFSIRGIPNR